MFFRLGLGEQIAQLTSGYPFARPSIGVITLLRTGMGPSPSGVEIWRTKGYLIEFFYHKRLPTMIWIWILGCPWYLVTSNLGYFTYLGDLQPTYIGVIIQLLSTMDIPVEFYLVLVRREWNDLELSLRFRSAHYIYIASSSRELLYICHIWLPGKPIFRVTGRPLVPNIWLGWVVFFFFNFTSPKIGGNAPIWRAYFFQEWVGSTTN